MVSPDFGIRTFRHSDCWSVLRLSDADPWRNARIDPPGNKIYYIQQRSQWGADLPEHLVEPHPGPVARAVCDEKFGWFEQPFSPAVPRAQSEVVRVPRFANAKGSSAILKAIGETRNHSGAEQRDEDTLTELIADMWSEGARPTEADYAHASELLGFTVEPSAPVTGNAETVGPGMGVAS